VSRPTTRFEIKYRLAPDHGKALRAYIEGLGFMQPDANGEGGSPLYSVHSLYLDSLDWSIYRDTRAGNFERFKLRARCYAFTPDAIAFLEVKHRAGEAMWKTRAPVSRLDAIRAVNREPIEADWTPAVENFRAWADRRRAIPRVWVTYRRYAYVGGTRDLVRVTFDTRIQVAPPTLDMSEPPVWYPVKEVEALEVLELKYTGSYPRWLAETVRKFDLERKAMSKYKYGVDLIRAKGLDQVNLARGAA
jgi:VTC domain